MWETALRRLKLGARLMMRGKGDTYQKGLRNLLEKKRGTCKKKRLIIRGENGALLTPKKMGAHQGIKRDFIRLRNGHLSTEKRRPSYFDRGIYKK